MDFGKQTQDGMIKPQNHGWKVRRQSLILVLFLNIKWTLVSHVTSLSYFMYKLREKNICPVKQQGKGREETCIACQIPA